MRSRSSAGFSSWCWVIGWGSAVVCLLPSLARGTGPEPIAVEGQPLAANVQRLVEALEFLGAPLPAETRAALRSAGETRDAAKIQKALDPHVLLLVTLAASGRVEVGAGPAPAVLQQAGYTPVLVKVVNPAGTTRALRICESAVRPGLRGSGSPEHDPAGPDAVEGERERQRKQGPLPPAGNVHQPTHDGQAERPGGGVRHRPGLQQRSGAAPGRHRLLGRGRRQGPRRDACSL